MRSILGAIMLAMVVADASAADGVRVKDLVRIDGWRESQLVGYGIVTGLAGTGDSIRNKATQQSIANLMTQYGINVTGEQVQSRNVAAVMVTTALPPYARNGDKLDVMVTSIGDARSLLGGALLLTPLKGVDGKIRSLAQGPISVGGYKYDLNGNLVQKNHPTVGTIPGGANIESENSPQIVKSGNTIALLLATPDYATAGRIASSVNESIGTEIARAVDAGRVLVRVTDDRMSDIVNFVARIESTPVNPDGRSRVVVNERTGTVVSGGDVRISAVTIAHGDLKVSISTDYFVSQPSSYFGNSGPGARTVVVPQTHIDVVEGNNIFLSANNSVTDLVAALNKLKTNTRDIISILQGIKTAGALHADLIIQ